MSLRTLIQARIPATVRGIVSRIGRRLARMSVADVQREINPRVQRLVNKLTPGDKVIVNNWIAETVAAVRAGSRMTDRPGPLPDTRLPVTTQWGPSDEGSYRYFTIVVVRDVNTGIEERIPVEYTSDRALSTEAITQAAINDTAENRIRSRSLSPRGPVEQAEVVRVIVVTAERRG